MRNLLPIELDLINKGFVNINGVNEFSSYGSPTTYEKDGHSFTLWLGTIIGSRKHCGITIYDSKSLIEYYPTNTTNALGDNGIHLDFKTLKSEDGTPIDLSHLNIDNNYNVRNI